MFKSFCSVLYPLLKEATSKKYLIYLRVEETVIILWFVFAMEDFHQLFSIIHRDLKRWQFKVMTWRVNQVMAPVATSTIYNIYMEKKQRCVFFPLIKKTQDLIWAAIYPKQIDLWIKAQTVSSQVPSCSLAWEWKKNTSWTSIS